MKNKEHSFKSFNASSLRVGIVCAKFNSKITGEILNSALAKLSEYKIPANRTTISYVPGSVEIPIMLQKLAKKKKYDCLVAIGAVIKGETDHYVYVCKLVCEGVLRVMLDHSLPIGFGVLTVQSEKLAETRTAIGGQAVEAAIIVASQK